MGKVTVSLCLQQQAAFCCEGGDQIAVEMLVLPTLCQLKTYTYFTIPDKL